ncbi:cupin domain-containing protein [Altererythrobacter arenosus]|uniref:Cupin domain-containing protein n=1 Tax=Altererythrobacter arenosus TaxID=3032592 RepID=A0ABY8FRG5_9SPHN|nr:cupin domain-containing protein [Altererythrobacter sp. CAU 1644]WFL77609.1 cupin domain-containing protein [Altererythrobacter sp. CAU 1644]
MRVNADFDAPVAERTAAMDWIASPMPGVERKMLDRIGDEVARATSIVRYAPGSHFAEHTHSGGEEFIVLEGTFQDEHGDYPAGTYVRNPIGTRHIPRSDEGCTIFVKLWQFDERDQEQFAIDLNRQGLKAVTGVDGVSAATLFDGPNETVRLELWAAGAQRGLVDPGGVELLILEGVVEWEGQAFTRHDWIRIPRDQAAPFLAGPDGARVWMKSGHLSHVRVPGP